MRSTPSNSSVKARVTRRDAIIATRACLLKIAEARRGSGNRPASLEIPQDGKAGAGCGEMLECMSAQDSDRIDRVIVEFTQFGECVERRGDQPPRRAGIFWRTRDE